jgi:hypothetical protein
MRFLLALLLASIALPAYAQSRADRCRDNIYFCNEPAYTAAPLPTQKEAQPSLPTQKKRDPRAGILPPVEYDGPTLADYSLSEAITK